MRVANLSEPDKQRIVGYLEFNVPNEQKEAVEKLLAAVGPVLDRKNEQVAITDIATNQKFGYVVYIYSVAKVAPVLTSRTTPQLVIRRWPGRRAKPAGPQGVWIGKRRVIFIVRGLISSTSPFGLVTVAGTEM